MKVHQKFQQEKSRQAEDEKQKNTETEKRERRKREKKIARLSVFPSPTHTIHNVIFLTAPKKKKKKTIALAAITMIKFAVRTMRNSYYLYKSQKT